jgi:transporter family-2 protein
LSGGLLGAWLVVSQTITVPRIGVALSVVALVSGLIVTGIAVDAAGMGPAGRRPPTPARLVAGGLAIAAVGVDLAPELAAGATAFPAYHLLAFSAGCGVAFQQAFNGRVAAATGQPVLSGWINFVIGALALGLVVLGLSAAGAVPLAPIPFQPWWLYTPGVLGATFVTLAAWAVRWIGVLRLGLLSVTGQLVAAFAFDLLAPMINVTTEARVGLGVLISLAAAVLASRAARPR